MSIFGTGFFQMIYALDDVTITPDYTDLSFTKTDHDFYDGQMVQIKSSVSLPAGMATDTIYYINIIDKDTFELSENFKGDSITFTDDGSGTIELYYTEETITLDVAIKTPDYSNISFPSISPITGKKHINNKGRYINFKLKYHLWKKEDTLIVYNNIIKFLYQLVKIKQYSDGELFQDQYSNTILYSFSEIEEYNLTELDYRDLLILYFEATGYIDKSKTTASVIAADDIIIGDGGFI